MRNPASLANLKPYRPGQSGNTHGRPKAYHTVLRLARVNSADAILTLVQCMNDPEAPWPARVSAANGLLDRAWGKAPQNVTVDGESAALLRIQFVDTGGDAATVTIERSATKTKTIVNGHDDGDGTFSVSFDDGDAAL